MTGPKLAKETERSGVETVALDLRCPRSLDSMDRTKNYSNVIAIIRPLQ